MQRIKDKKAAMEMSIGTIVTIVLLVSVLVLGLVLIRSIFTSAKGVVDLTDQELRKKIGEIFTEDKKLAVYPTSRRLEIPQGDIDGFGIGIQNLLEGSSATKTFSYEVVVSDPDLRKKCEVTESEALDLIGTITEGTEKRVKRVVAYRENLPLDTLAIGYFERRPTIDDIERVFSAYDRIKARLF